MLSKPCGMYREREECNTPNSTLIILHVFIDITSYVRKHQITIVICSASLFNRVFRFLFSHKTYAYTYTHVHEKQCKINTERKKPTKKSRRMKIKNVIMIVTSMKVALVLPWDLHLSSTSFDVNVSSLLIQSVHHDKIVEHQETAAMIKDKYLLHQKTMT